MKKLTKRFAAMGAAVMMMASMSAVGASADSWSVQNIAQVECENEFLAGADGIAGVWDSCNTYNTSTAGNGQIAYVRYWGYTTDISGNVQTGQSFGSRYYYSTDGSHNVPLTSKTKKGNYLHVHHKIENSYINSNMNGNVSAYY